MDDKDAEINDGGLSAAANVAATSGGGTGGSASDGGHMPPTATSGGLPAPPRGHLAAIGASPSTAGGGTDGTPAVPDCASATSCATTAGISAQFMATPFMTLGIAPGDGDLLHARFGGDSSADAEEWARDFVDYIHIRRTPFAAVTTSRYGPQVDRQPAAQPGLSRDRPSLPGPVRQQRCNSEPDHG